MRGLAGYVAAGGHGDGAVGLLQGQHVVDAVAGHGHGVALSLQSLHQLFLLVRGHAAEHGEFSGGIVYLFRGVQGPGVHEFLRVRNSRALCHLGDRHGVIAGYDLYGNALGRKIREGRGGFLAYLVGQQYQRQRQHVRAYLLVVQRAVVQGQELTGSARPLRSLKANDGIPNWDEIEKLIKEWQPDLLVVGLPLNMDGTEQEITVRARKFGNRLHGRFGKQVEFKDERLTTTDARARLFERGGYKALDKGSVDGVSAQLIVEAWMEEQYG